MQSSKSRCLNLKKTALDRDQTRVLLQHIQLPYPLRRKDKMKILMKKERVLLKLKWDADWALSPLPHANYG